MKQERYYQTEAIKASKDFLQQGFWSQLLTLPTGCGKTYTAIQITKDFQRILWLSHTEELIEQSANAWVENTGYEVGIVKAEKFDIDKRVVMGSAQTMHRRLERLSPDYFDCIVADECDLFLAETFKKTLGYFKPKILLGLSVHPDSFIEVKGDVFDDGFCGYIEEAWSIASKKYSIEIVGEYEVILLNNCFSRGWDGVKFTWKPIKSFIRHLCDRECTEIFVGGKKLIVTNEHSIYTIDKSLVLKNSLAENIQPGEICLHDTAYENNGDLQLNVVDFLSKSKYSKQIKVCVDLSKLSHEEFKLNGINYKQKYEFLKKGKYGQYLPINIFLKLKNTLPEPTKIYHESCNGSYILPKFKLSELAYLIGFYYGDGWFSEDLLAFAVEESQIKHFISYIKSLTCIKFNYKAVKQKGNSYEVKLYNTHAVRFLKSILGNKKCYEKELLSQIITTWDKDSRVQLINGLIDSDGSISKISENKIGCYYTSTSVKLIKGISSLLRSIGVKSTIHKRAKSTGGIIDGRQIVGKRDSYTLYWSYNSLIGNNNGRNGIQKSFDHKDLDFIEAKVKLVTPVIDKPKYVYDFEMEGHPSFVADGILVHNTATPYRADGVPLEDMFQKTIYEYTIEQAVADGFLCKPDAIKVKTSCNLDGVHTLAGEFNQKELTEKVNTLERNNAIANKYIEYAAGRQFIAFCVDVQHAIDLCETFNEKGVKCEYVVGDKKLTTDRKGVIDGFKNGEYEGLTNCFVLVAGFDHPNTGCLIMACPTKSKRKFIQQVGRGLRLKDDEFVSKFGQNCIILDVVDVSSKHRVINTDELDKYKNTEDKLFMPQWEKDRIAQKKLERMMSEVAVEEKIELFPLPKVKFQRAFNSKEPATEAQLYLLKHRGYDVVNNIYTKGMVNEILMTESASLEDIRNLQSAGYDVSNGVTFAEAKLAYQEIQRRDKR